MRFRVVILVAALLGAAAPATAQEPTLETLRDAARRGRRDAAAQATYARALLRAGRYREARQTYLAAARLQRRSPEALYDVARVAFAEGDYRAAQTACRAVERAAAGSVLSHVCSARTFLVWNRSARAFGEIEAALALDGNHYEALLALGEAHRLRAAVSEAEAAYRRAAAADASRAEPQLELGRLYAAAGRRPDAVRALRDALRKDPDSPEITYELGTLLGGSEEGRALLGRAVVGRPAWVEARVALGHALIAAQQWDAAREAFEGAVEQSRNAADAYTGLGEVLTHLGRHEEAEAALDRAVALVPNSHPAALGLARLYVATDRNEEAFAKFREAQGFDPRDPAALLEAAALAIRLRRDVLAAGFLDRLLDVHSDLAQGLALYGDAMKLRGDRSAARQYYQRALAGQGALDRARVEQALRELGPAAQPQTRRRVRRPRSRQH